MEQQAREGLPEEQQLELGADRLVAVVRTKGWAGAWALLPWEW